MNQTTAPPDERLLGAYDPTPLIRPLEYPSSLGRLWTAMLDENGRPAADEFQAEWLLVTPRGHWYMSKDCAAEPAYVSSALCRAEGCGTAAEFIPELDARPCTHPATAQDIASALLASLSRPAPVAPRALYAGVSA